MSAFVPDAELEERRLLLEEATKGSLPAQQKLEREYHVRVYSALEREKYAVTRTPDSIPLPRRRKNRSVH